MKTVFDLETIPRQHPGFFEELLAEFTEAADKEAAEVSPPGNIKDPEKIAKWWEETGNPRIAAIRAGAAEKADEKYRATALDAAYGQIAVISYAIDNEDPLAIWSPNYADDEVLLLRRFYTGLTERVASHVNQLQFIGHNIIGFDLRFLFQRSVINSIRPPAFIPFRAKPWDAAVFDTMTAWAGDRGHISQDRLCKALGIPGKPDDIDGSKVWNFVRDGQIEKVAEYCNGDVIRARECADRLMFKQAA